MLVSAPGKVLLAGGYLVLDPAYRGLILATSSRFYAWLKEEELGQEKEKADEDEGKGVTVYAPQFVGAKWQYGIKKVAHDSDSEGGGSSCRLVGLEGDDKKNTFVEVALCESFRLASALTKKDLSDLLPKHLTVYVLADNDFYSQSRDAPPSIPFAPLGRPITNVHKTGLGSSAALVTAISGAVLTYTKALTVTSTTLDNSPIFHNLAQYIHSRAQNKVGSGFDISAAVFGSQIYQRFHPSLLSSLLEKEIDDIEPQALLNTLNPVLNSGWNHHPPGPVHDKNFHLPPHTVLVLADVDAGTNTPSFVSKVLNWAKQNPQDSNDFYTKIDRLNLKIADLFQTLCKLALQDKDSYITTLKKFALVPSNHWVVDINNDSNQVGSTLIETRNVIAEFRSNMKAMGDAASVPIEPDEQTKLLDSTLLACPGILGNGVPGAGGYDAAWSLVLCPPGVNNPIANLEKYFYDYKDLSVRTLSKDAFVYGINMDQENKTTTSGARIEDPTKITGLEQAIKNIDN